MIIEYFTFVETGVFTKQIERLASTDTLIALQNELLDDPKLGDVIPGTGGARKARIGSGTKGKRGGFRYIYFYLEGHGVIYLILFYGKNEQDNLTPEQTRRLRSLVLEVKKNYSERGKA